MRDAAARDPLLGRVLTGRSGWYCQEPGSGMYTGSTVGAALLEWEVCVCVCGSTLGKGPARVPLTWAMSLWPPALAPVSLSPPGRRESHQ